MRVFLTFLLIQLQKNESALKLSDTALMSMVNKLCISLSHSLLFNLGVGGGGDYVLLIQLQKNESVLKLSDTTITSMLSKLCLSLSQSLSFFKTHSQTESPVSGVNLRYLGCHRLGGL